MCEISVTLNATVGTMQMLKYSGNMRKKHSTEQVNGVAHHIQINIFEQHLV